MSLTIDDIGARLEDLERLLRALTPPPLDRPHAAGQLVQIDSRSSHAYAGLPGLIVATGAYRIDVAPLVPHRGGMSWKFDAHDLLPLPWPTPPHHWITAAQVQEWSTDFNGWIHTPGWYAQLKRETIAGLKPTPARKPPQSSHRLNAANVARYINHKSR